MGNIFSDFFGGGGKAARRAEEAGARAEQRLDDLTKRLEEERRAGLEATMDRLGLLQNPVLAQLAGAAQGVTARRTSSLNALSRTGGGPRTGRTFGLARGALTQRFGAEAGLEAALVRLQALQTEGQLREADLGARRNVLGQGEALSNRLRELLLSGRAGVANTTTSGVANVAGQAMQGLPNLITSTGQLLSGIGALKG